LGDKLKKAIWGTGGFAVGSALGAQVFGYFEGLAFHQWFFAPLVFVPLLLGSIGAFLVCSISLLISVFRGQQSLRVLVPMLLFPALFMGSYRLPVPRFVDGLHEAVESKLDRQRLIDLATAARALDEGRIDLRGSIEKLDSLNETFGPELGLSSLDARMSVTDDWVSVYYGSALTKHWGYAIVNEDKCPFERIPKHLCRKVFDNVWVYRDIW